MKASGVDRVMSDDPVVRKHVSEFALRIGAELRSSVLPDLVRLPPAPRALPIAEGVSEHGHTA